MASNYPTSLDNFTNPTVSDYLNSTTVPHATQHSDLNDAVENLQAKVGIDSSADTGSIDYKVTDAASRITTLEAGATANAIVAYADLAARTAANPSPSEGDVSWQEDTNRFDIYNGSAWVYAGGGTFSTWSPSYVNLSGGTTDVAKFARVGDLVFCVWTYTCAGADVSGGVTVSLPVTASSSYDAHAVGTARFTNTGVDVWEGRVTLDSTTTIQLRRLIDDSGSTKLRPISSTLPFTFGAGDILTAEWTYEAA